jgi:diguanylate cyclase (GGDEF)-like protein
LPLDQAVEPGLLIFANITCIGVALVLFIQSCIIYTVTGRQKVYLGFILLSLFIFAFLYFSLKLYLASSLEEAIIAGKWQLTSSFLYIPLIVFLVGEVTYHKNYKSILFLTTFFNVLMFLVGAFTDYGVRFTDIYQLKLVTFDWGEKLYILTGEPSNLALIFRLESAIVLLWALSRAKLAFQSQSKRTNYYLFPFLIIQFSTMILGGFIDYGFVDLVYIAGLPFFFFGFILSIELSLELSRQNIRLLTTTTNLKHNMVKRSEAEARIKKLAYYDVLTELPNTRKLETEFCEQQLERKNLCFVLVDIDGFQYVNEGLGQSTGNLLLKQFSSRMSRVDKFTFLARYSGDKFISIFSFDDDRSTNQAEIKAYIDSIRACFEEKFEIHNFKIELTASYGVSCGFFSFHQHLNQADMAMHWAKKQHHNSLKIYDETMISIVSHRLHIAQSLTMGIESGQFELYYQPQINCDEKISGAEALIRWNHPEKGLVSPLEFIRIAEETGLIVELGEWIINDACQTLNQWQNSSFFCGCDLSINVSTLQLEHANFVANLIRSINHSNIDPKMLKIEITESALIDNLEKSIEKLDQIIALGITVAIDDFGTGYSSLSHLKDLPINLLKIDKSFIDGLPEEHSPLVGSIINMGHSMQQNVLAEGVESIDQIKALKKLGCDYFQGFYYSKPLSKKEFETWANRFSLEDNP